jgi:hypothetical protein
MSVVGMSSDHPGQSDDGVAVDADQTFGLSDAAAVAEVLEHGVGLVLGQVGVEQGRALAFGEAIFAGVAVEQPNVVLLAVAGADGEVSGVAFAVERAVGFLAAEAREVVHGCESPLREGRVEFENWERDESSITTPIPLQMFYSIVPGHNRTPRLLA